MACVALSSLMRTIELDLLNPGRSAIVEDEEQVKYLYQSLGFLKEFLDKSKDNVAAKNLEPKIKDSVFQIEDRIEKKLETIYGETYSDPQRQKAQRRLSSTLKQAIRDTDDLKVEIRRILYSPVQDFPSADPQASCGGSSEHAAASDVMEGRGGKFKEIMDQLIPKGSSGREVISIVGMGGTGKTTLARRLYEDPLVLSHFDILGWTVVSQKHDVRRMLLDLINNEAAKIDKVTDSELAEKLQKCLRGQRYLIVLDDIWSTSCWEHIQLCFPDDNCGSRILLTTRHKEVADCADDSGNRLHTLGFLNQEDSWNLFCKSFPGIQSFSFELKTIGRQVVNKCHGLPLAIVVVAGVLSKLSQTVEEWQVFENQTNSLVVTTDLSEQCSRILTLSYNYLPLHLKSCFLYLSTVPQDKAIIVKRLVRLWIAEGFVELINSEKLEEVAHGYLQDLLDRCLILIDNRHFNGEIKTCRMHNMVHEFCVREAIKEKLLNADNEQHPCGELQQEGCRWLNFWPKKIIRRDGLRDLDNIYVPRSILYLQRTSYASSSEVNEPNDDLRWGLLLRVLEFSRPITSGSSLNCISLLRYLGICLGDSSLPLGYLLHLLSRSQNLQTLIVSHKPNSIIDGLSSCHYLSSEMWASQELSHVECSYLISLDPPNEVKEKLHTLYWLSPRHCTEEVFSRIPNVRKLGIFCRPETDDGGDDDDVFVMVMVVVMRMIMMIMVMVMVMVMVVVLVVIAVMVMVMVMMMMMMMVVVIDDDADADDGGDADGVGRGNDDDDDDREVGLNNILENLHHLNQLETLKIRAINQNICLRNPQAFPQNLKELTLYHTRLRWKHINIIGNIPSLQVLKLKREAVCGETWEPSHEGFCQLKFLLIDYCDQFQYWEATTPYHYPVLERLVIRNCRLLKEFPDSFEDMINLRLIEISNCSPLLNSAYRIQEAQKELGNDKLVVRDATPLSRLGLGLGLGLAPIIVPVVAIVGFAALCQIM
ncbi:putative late blight resistance protein homolog R1A-10 [Ipomoea triloba]|uniref:putative late blight resistance protein homolog R1A-10 n=1 Tax=Ipomoea triloba TaxID=35885 RepID=UPI00125E792A|nr:putative late blight resistance protein homolog R1A-10 [Ipomoea triloba]